MFAILEKRRNRIKERLTDRSAQELDSRLRGYASDLATTCQLLDSVEGKIGIKSSHNVPPNLPRFLNETSNDWMDRCYTVGGYVQPRRAKQAKGEETAI